MRSTLLVVSVVVLLGGALTAGLLAGGSGTEPARTKDGAPAVTLSVSFDTAAGSWAILPMGDLSQPLNTFWQVFFRPTGSTGWRLVTPPGVADNGGFSASVDGDGAVTVLFEPSNQLAFSPLTSSSDNGKNWSSGIVPFGAEAGPDVLVADSAGGRSVVLEHGGAQVLTGTGDGASWTTLFTKRTIARSAGGIACGVQSLTAVGAIGSQQLAASGCARPGVVGIFAAARSTAGLGGWQLIGPRLPASRGDVSVLRMWSAGDRIEALVDAHDQKANYAYALWKSRGASVWKISAPLPLGPNAQIVSTGSAPAGTVVIETKTSNSLSAETVGLAHATSWSVLPALPQGTQDVSYGADGKIEALCVSSSHLTAWTLSAGRWASSGSLLVPIQYGSSS